MALIDHNARHADGDALALALVPPNSWPALAAFAVACLLALITAGSPLGAALVLPAFGVFAWLFVRAKRAADAQATDVRAAAQSAAQSAADAKDIDALIRGF